MVFFDVLNGHIPTHQQVVCGCFNVGLWHGGGDDDNDGDEDVMTEPTIITMMEKKITNEYRTTKNLIANI